MSKRKLSSRFPALTVKICLEMKVCQYLVTLCLFSCQTFRRVCSPISTSPDRNNKDPPYPRTLYLMGKKQIHLGDSSSGTVTL